MVKFLSKYRKFILIFIDMIIVNIALCSAIYLQRGNICGMFMGHKFTVISLTVISILIFSVFRMYSSSWRYAEIREYLQVYIAVLIVVIINTSILETLNFHFAKAVMVTWGVLLIIGLCSIRTMYKFAVEIIFSQQNSHLLNKKRVMIVGAGSAGNMIIREMYKRRDLGIVVVACDDDPAKKNVRTSGVLVAGSTKLIPELVKRYKVDEIIIAIVANSSEPVKRIVELCTKTNCKIKVIPPMSDYITGKNAILQIKEVNITDLLGRKEVELEVEEITKYIKDEVVLVTGGGGSIGSELCRQIAKHKPKLLIVFDIYENNAYELENELKDIYKQDLNLKILIGSVRDIKRLDDIFETFKPSVIFHAAAHKHVPLMENSPNEAIKNNVYGTMNVAKCADKHGSKRFVLISTDKAVNPTNIMGASKRIAELVIQNLNRTSKTIYAAVRFGNVLGSNGSVVPLFKKQIADGGPITVTHPDIVRFFMTIPEAAQLVLQAGAFAEGGEIFILDMGAPVKIVDLAKDLIKLSGLRPNIDIKIEYTGLRPGEKMFEELLIDETRQNKTKHNKIFIEPPYDENQCIKKEIQKLKANLKCESKLLDKIENNIELLK